MNEKFDYILEKYKDYLNIYGTPGSNMLDVSSANNYFTRFWLSEIAYQDEWQGIHGAIFELSKQLPEMVFKKDFEFISLLGGVVFERKDFELFKRCLKALNEDSFVIIQDTFSITDDQRNYTFKMKFPVDIDWHTLKSGNFLSTALFDACENNYYVFGSSSEWGMYVANDYVDESVNLAGTPICIIGFNPMYRAIFRDNFQILGTEYCENLDYMPIDERPNLKDWIPMVYR